MSIEQTVYLGLNLSAFVLFTAILILTILSGNLKKRAYFYFFLTVLFCFLGMLSDFVVEWMIGQTSPVIDVAIRILDCFSYSTSGLQLVFFAAYLCEYLSTRTAVSKKPFLLMEALGYANIALAIVASVTGLYVHFDEYNNYIQQDTFWISELLPTATLIVCVCITVRYMRVLKSREWMSLISYSILPITFYGLELLWPDVYLASVGVSITLFIIYANLQVELNHQLMMQEVELTENRIAIMLSQIQPHFLYNSLTAIDNLFYNNPEQGHEALYTFSEYLRGNMDSLAQKELVSFEQELLHTKQYLHLEKLRFRDKLGIVYEINADTFWMPVLTLQPIVENAVRYGVTKKQSGGCVLIRTEADDKTYRIIVKDNGVGFDPANPPAANNHDDRSHMGIANVRGRLEAMCGGTLLITSAPGSGTTAVIEIPRSKGEMR